MAENWTVVLRPSIKPLVAALARRRKMLGLEDTYAKTIEASVALAMTASNDDLKRGEL